MKNIVRKIKMYFEGKAIWKAKMSEPLKIRIVSSDNENSDKELKSETEHVYRL